MSDVTNNEYIHIISHRTRILLAAIPLLFVKRSGYDSWEFVIHILRLLPNVNLTAVSVLYSGDVWLDPSLPVWGGTFGLHEFHIASNGITVPPFTRIKPVSSPTFSECWLYRLEEGTAEFEFCSTVTIRDRQCLLSSEHWEKCIPTHIVPTSRIDIYQELLDIDYDNHPHDLNFGLLLRPDLSQAFERFEWSFYLDNGIFHVHFFDPCTPLALEYHGKVFDSSRFGAQGWTAPRLLWKGEVPDSRLLAWHYQQGVQVFADRAGDYPRSM